MQIRPGPEMWPVGNSDSLDTQDETEDWTSPVYRIVKGGNHKPDAGQTRGGCMPQWTMAMTPQR